MYRFSALLLSCTLIVLSCKKEEAAPTVSTPRAFDQAVETESILGIIDNEASCFYARDYECWKAHYIHEDYTFQGWNRADGTFDAKVGWGELDEKAGTYIKNNPPKEGQGERPQVIRQFMKVKFFTNTLAYVSWDQYNPDGEAKIYTHSLETRLMQNLNGSWKIANSTSFYDYLKQFPADSLK
ncbi:MAG: hypothetical protein IPL92_07775 [Saprospiraceae bacterium]|nr:hypothetical protein [Candidatus Opimibacter iunctus]